MVATIIYNGLLTTGFKDLFLHQDAFAYNNATTNEMELDCLTMLYLIYTKIDPDTVVRLDFIGEKLEKTKLRNFNNDVYAMLIDMEEKYKILPEQEQSSPLELL